MSERAPFLTLGHAIRHRIYLLVAIIAGFTMLAGIAAIVRPPSYLASAVLSVDERFVSPQGFDISLQTGQPLVDHFIQLASSRAVLDRACSGAYSGVTCNAGTLAGSVSVSAADSPGLIVVSGTASSAVRAAALTNAVARAMVDQNRVDDARLVEPISDYLNSELQRLDKAITSEEAAIAGLQGQPGQQAALAGEQQKLSLLRQQYLDTSQRLQDLGIVQRRLDETLNLGQSAAPPAGPYDPDPVRYLGVGLVVGLCVALAVTLLVDRFDDRLFDTESLSAAAGTRLAIAVAARDSESLTVHSTNPYAVARANLLATHPQLSKLMIVGASDSEQLRPIAIGVGAAAVKAGQRVLVLDPDAPALVMEQQAGRSGSSMTVVHAPSSATNPATTDGQSPPGDYDLVITLAPPPDANPIAVSLARSGEVAIVVATARSTRFSDVKRTSETLRIAGIDVAASILSLNTPKKLDVVDDTPAPGALPDLQEVAASAQRLPTWRGPGA